MDNISHIFVSKQPFWQFHKIASAIAAIFFIPLKPSTFYLLPYLPPPHILDMTTQYLFAPKRNYTYNNIESFLKIKKGGHRQKTA